MVRTLPGFDRRRIALLGCFVLIALVSCDKKQEAPVMTPPPAAKAAVVVDFPASLEAADKSVNDFVRSAVQICLAHNYDEFRLLWTARENPMSREEFDASWKAVRVVRVRALQKALYEQPVGDAPPKRDVVYAAYAEVELDPSHPAGASRPRREIVLMLIPENGQWRLATAPPAMRKWIREQAGVSELADSATSQSSEPTNQK